MYIKRNTKTKAFNLNLKFLVVNMSVSSFTMSIPINIKIKNISNSALPVIKKRISIHAVITRVIFSDIYNFLFTYTIFLLRNFKSKVIFFPL